jgi:peroxiredoxin
LKGKIVVVNFWATWCPPCRKEMPDLGEIYRQFKDQGLVVLAISDEAEPVVRKYVTDHEVRYPVLLDPGRKVNGVFQVDGIPKTFFYGRDGKLAAQAMDMRTRGQFLELLARAGLREEKPAPAGRTH